MLRASALFFLAKESLRSSSFFSSTVVIFKRLASSSAMSSSFAFSSCFLIFSTVKKPCHYCGTTPIKPHREDSSFLYNGLDRFDNNLGYVESNIVPCCFICNKMKGVLTKEDFMEHLNSIFTRIQ